MSTRASRAKKPQINPKVVEKPQYVTIGQLNNAMSTVSSDVGRWLGHYYSKVQEEHAHSRNHTEALHVASLEEFKARQAEGIAISTKQVNTLIGMNCAVTGTMNVMQQLPGLLRDQNKALWAIRSILGTLVFLVLMTEIVIAIAAFSFIHLK